MFLGGGGGREGLVSSPGGGGVRQREGGVGARRECLGPQQVGGSSSVWCVCVCLEEEGANFQQHVCSSAKRTATQAALHPFLLFQHWPRIPTPHPTNTHIVHRPIHVPPPPPQGTALFCLLALGGMAIGVGYGLATSIWLEQVFR